MPASQYGNSKAKPKAKAKAKAKVSAKPKVGKAKKPDFLDVDMDGDKKEPMKKAAKKPAAKKAPAKKKAAPKKKAAAAPKVSGGSLARTRETKMRMSNPSMTYA
tara:strand:+ start:737 stop:1048 length:312 start_codon:yes stop_codon:yes gene_type:complete